MFFESDSLTYKKEVASKEVAKERLKGILMRDRIDISCDVVEMVKADVIEVVKDYFSIRDNSAEVYLTNMKRNDEDKEENVLVAVVPIFKSIKKEEEEFILD